MFVNLIDELAQATWERQAGIRQIRRHYYHYSLFWALGSTSSSAGAVLLGASYEANWERVLIAVEDVSERGERDVSLLALSEDYARGLFEHSPISLWVEDFSHVKLLMDEVRERGIEDFRVFTGRAS